MIGNVDKYNILQSLTEIFARSHVCAPSRDTCKVVSAVFFISPPTPPPYMHICCHKTICDAYSNTNMSPTTVFLKPTGVKLAACLSSVLKKKKFWRAFLIAYLTTKHNVNLSETKQILPISQITPGFQSPICSKFPLRRPPDHSYLIVPLL